MSADGGGGGVVEKMRRNCRCSILLLLLPSIHVSSCMRSISPADSQEAALATRIQWMNGSLFLSLQPMYQVLHVEKEVQLIQGTSSKLSSPDTTPRHDLICTSIKEKIVTKVYTILLI